jgi:hypothetical protein
LAVSKTPSGRGIKNRSGFSLTMENELPTVNW